jgi:hypothetical protein
MRLRTAHKRRTRLLLNIAAHDACVRLFNKFARATRDTDDEFYTDHRPFDGVNANCLSAIDEVEPTKFYMEKSQ